MSTKLYLGIEGVLLRDSAPDDPLRSAFGILPGADQFVNWAVMGFECYWLTHLNQDGGDERIRQALLAATGLPSSSDQLDMLFEMVAPTYWEDAMVEGIDLDSNFYWLAHEPDATSLQVVDRRGLSDRLIICSPDDEPEVFARVQCQLGGLAE